MAKNQEEKKSDPLRGQNASSYVRRVLLEVTLHEVR